MTFDEVKETPWWALLVIAAAPLIVLAVLGAALYDFLMLRPER